MEFAAFACPASQPHSHYASDKSCRFETVFPSTPSIYFSCRGYDTKCRVIFDNGILFRGNFNAQKPTHPAVQHSVDTIPLIQLWLVRLLIGLGTHREFITDNGFSNDGMAQAIGLGNWVDCTRQEFDRKKVLTELRKVHRAFEVRFKDTVAPTILRDNVDRLSKLVGLSPTDCRILEFAVLIRNESLLDEACDRLGTLSLLIAVEN